MHVTFTSRRSDTLVRVIAARDASQKEKNYYEQADYEENPQICERS
jgi:uncharacterized DUF497 family protein